MDVKMDLKHILNEYTGMHYTHFKYIEYSKLERSNRMRRVLGA